MEKYIAIAAITFFSVFLQNLGGAQELEAPQANVPQTSRSELLQRLKVKNLKNFFESSTKMLLKNHLENGEFSVLATVELVETETSENSEVGSRIPYLPGSSVGSGSSSLTDTTKERIASVDLNVTIGQGYPAQGRQQLQALIADHFDLGEKLTVNVAEINLRIPDNAQDLSQQLQASDRELRQIRDRLNDQQLSNQAMTQEIRDKDTKISNLQNELDLARGRIGKSLSFGEKIQENLVWVVVAGGLFLAFLIGTLSIAMAFFKMGSRLENGFGQLAKSQQKKEEDGLSGLGSSTNEVAANIGLSGAEKEAIAGPKESGNLKYTLSVEGMQARLLELHQEIVQLVENQATPAVVRYVSQLLVIPDGARKTLVLLELLGQSLGKDVFSNLEKNQQFLLQKSLSKGEVVRGDKYETMLEVGESLKTFLMAEMVGNPENHETEEIATTIRSLGEDDLAELTVHINESVLPRFVYHLETPQLLRTMDIIRKKHGDFFPKVANALINVPKMENQASLDSKLLPMIKSQLNSMHSNSDRNLISYLRPIMAEADSGLTEEWMQTIGRSNPEVRQTLSREILVLDSIFQMSKQSRAEIISEFSSRQVGALLTLLEEEEQKLILELLDETKNVAVREAYETIASRKPSQITAEQDQVRNLVVQKLKALKQQADWEERFQVEAQDEDVDDQFAAA